MAERIVKKFTLDSQTGDGESTIHTFSQVTTVAALPTNTTASAITVTGCDANFYIVGQTYLLALEHFG